MDTNVSDVSESDILLSIPKHITEPKYKELILLDVKKTNPLVTMEEIDAVLKNHNKLRSEETYSYTSEPNEKINALMSVYQPAQRTEEWYQFRNEHITASNAWKALGTQSTQNQLIFEKCQPINREKYSSSLNETPMSWGHKYEPLTARLYEEKHNTQISDFGCIPHPTYSFLAASPDGIVTGTNNYGRMIEIKNVVSREITGVPKKDYYIQMQIQMEVCDLDECDFIETKFTEYETEHEYFNDTSEIVRGIIIVFIKDNDFFYKYLPFSLHGESDELKNEWIEHSMLEESLVWVKNIYWKLDVYSCILVKRQREWFHHSIPQLEKIWNTILEERVSGEYVKRSPKKRTHDKKEKECHVLL